MYSYLPSGIPQLLVHISMDLRGTEFSSFYFCKKCLSLCTCLFPLPDSELCEGRARDMSSSSEILLKIFKNKISLAHILLGLQPLLKNKLGTSFRMLGHLFFPSCTNSYSSHSRHLPLALNKCWKANMAEINTIQAVPTQ